MLTSTQRTVVLANFGASGLVVAGIEVCSAALMVGIPSVIPMTTARLQIACFAVFAVGFITLLRSVSDCLRKQEKQLGGH
jgi:membrane protein implicated in regulation of membrane protease activity